MSKNLTFCFFGARKNKIFYRKKVKLYKKIVNRSGVLRTAFGDGLHFILKNVVKRNQNFCNKFVFN